MSHAPTVLVTDDEEHGLAALQSYFSSLGYAIDTAATLDETVELLAGTASALVISDLRLGSQGTEGLHRVSAVASRYEEIQWIRRIREAIDAGSFRLHGQLIQPLADTPMPLMCEILLRIEKEGGDLVVPTQFIAAAERYHLMPTIDRWVVHRAFSVVRELTESASTMLYTINLSGQSIGERAFLGKVIAEIAAARIDPQRICFEITETAAIVNLAVALHFINELKGLGCRFALDDFGKGLASFAYLKNLRVDYLKIDGQFVRDVSKDPLHHALVESINKIGHIMGTVTIAECVEDAATMEVLKQLRVDYAQGYCIARPEPLDAGLIGDGLPVAPATT